MDKIQSRIQGLEGGMGSKRDGEKNLTRLKADGRIMNRILETYNDRLVEVTLMCQEQKMAIKIEEQ